jgi:hypothetical protein
MVNAELPNHLQLAFRYEAAGLESKRIFYQAIPNAHH